MEYTSLQQLAKVIKGIVLIGLVITFGFFIKEVWIKFTDKATNYMQSFNKVDFYAFTILEPKIRLDFGLCSLGGHQMSTLLYNPFNVL